MDRSYKSQRPMLMIFSPILCTNSHEITVELQRCKATHTTFRSCRVVKLHAVTYLNVFATQD